MICPVKGIDNYLFVYYMPAIHITLCDNFQKCSLFSRLFGGNNECTSYYRQLGRMVCSNPIHFVYFVTIIYYDNKHFSCFIPFEVHFSTL